MTICYKFNDKNTRPEYVANLKGVKGCVGWEYTYDKSKAKPLSPYWAKRFLSDCKAMGYTAVFLLIPNW